MVHDYSRRYSSVMGGRQQVANRRRQTGAVPFFLSKVLGTLMLLVVIAGVGMSVWLKMRIDADLGELASRIEQQGVLHSEGLELARRQQQLYALESISGRAASLGLALPSMEQIRQQK